MSESVVCAMCGATATEPPITWMLEQDPRRGPLWYCTDCARTYVRGIESRLAQEWW